MAKGGRRSGKAKPTGGGERVEGVETTERRRVETMTERRMEAEKEL